jgi:hypothetical protein
VLPFSAGTCVIFHFPPTYSTRASLDRILKTEADSPDCAAELIVDPRDMWACASASPALACTFNCCTYAVGEVAGLSVNDWLPSEASGDTLQTVPMQVVLDSFFDRIRVYRQPLEDWSVVEGDQSLRAGDVFCLVDSSGATPAYIHAGKICKRNGRNWVDSKLGPGPVVRSTVKALVVEYSKSREELWIYRQRGRLAARRYH